MYAEATKHVNSAIVQFGLDGNFPDDPSFPGSDVVLQHSRALYHTKTERVLAFKFNMGHGLADYLSHAGAERAPAVKSHIGLGPADALYHAATERALAI